MKDVFMPQTDVVEDVVMEESFDVIAQPIAKAMNAIQPQDKPIIAAAQKQNFVMNEEGDEIRELLRNAEDNLDTDPALREH